MPRVKIIRFRKLGNHWYPELYHDDVSCLSVDRKMEKMLTLIDDYELGYVDVGFVEQGLVIHMSGLVEFNDADIARYFTDNEPFTMHLKISGHPFTMSSNLYKALEEACDFQFDQLLYRIEI